MRSRAPHTLPALPDLALSLVGIGNAAAPREAIEWAREQEFRAVQLDATAPGLRPRDLDRSARRDLAALLRRLELGFAGLDLWIPPEHFADPTRADRALDAVGAALELAADLSRAHPTPGAPAPVVSLALPETGAEEVVGEIERRAIACGAVVADHAHPPRKDLFAHVLRGVDPAAILRRGARVAATVAGIGSGLIASARLTDWPDPHGRRGGLDALEYVMALLAAGYSRPLVLDARGATDAKAAALAARDAWGALVPGA